MSDWKVVPRQLRRQQQVDGVWQWPAPIEAWMSVTDFRARYPHAEHGATTICEPFQHNWIARQPDGTNLWISVSDDEVNPSRY